MMWEKNGLLCQNLTQKSTAKEARGAKKGVMWPHWQNGVRFVVLRSPGSTLRSSRAGRLHPGRLKLQSSCLRTASLLPVPLKTPSFKRTVANLADRSLLWNQKVAYEQKAEFNMACTAGIVRRAGTRPCLLPSPHWG